MGLAAGVMSLRNFAAMLQPNHVEVSKARTKEFHSPIGIFYGAHNCSGIFDAGLEFLFSPDSAFSSSELHRRSN